jgi:hypothetical protein
MRNLKPYDEDTISFFDEVVSARRNSVADPEFLTRIVTYRPGLILAYTAYDECCAAQSLMTARAVGHANPTKGDLLKLYSYKANVFKKLQLKLTTDENDRLLNTCQNCTINEINSFDHILPKDEFSEFAVNPKNLFPSCTQCNGYKSYVWQQGGIGLFLNLFLDILPQEQYLFANVIVGDEVQINYTIENRFGMDAGLFALIVSHYGRLHLPSRFSKNCDSIITELINSILSIKNELDKEKIKQVIIGKAERDLNKFGYNYWKAITVIALINSEDFYQFASDQED